MQSPTSSTSTRQMRERLPKLAKMCDQVGVSDRAGAALTIAVLVDFGVVLQTELTHVIDRYKLQREHKFTRDCLLKVDDSIKNPVL